MGGRLELKGEKWWKEKEADGKGDLKDYVPLRWAMMCKLVGRFEAVAWYKATQIDHATGGILGMTHCAK